MEVTQNLGSKVWDNKLCSIFTLRVHISNIVVFLGTWWESEGFPTWLSGKRISLPLQEMQVQFLAQEDPLEVEMEIHSSILAWEIPWTEETGRLQSMGLQRVGHD